MAEIDDQKLNLLLSEIKRKKVLRGIKDSLVLSEIDNLFKRNPSFLKTFQEKDQKELKRLSIFKEAIKEVRAALHKSYGMFNLDKIKKREKLFRQLENSTNKKDLVIHQKLLETNVSTRERIPIYGTIYKEIFSITSSPLSILDLSSGLNPLSFPWMGLNAVVYTATDVNENDKAFLNRYFDLMRKEGIDGKAITLDLASEDFEKELSEISKVDITLLFKVLESIEFVKKKKYKNVEAILNGIKSRWIVASFATKTVSGKSMEFRQRRWFELMLNRMGLKFSKIEKPNETFFIIKNKQ